MIAKYPELDVIARDQQLSREYADSTITRESTHEMMRALASQLLLPIPDALSRSTAPALLKEPIIVAAHTIRWVDTAKGKVWHLRFASQEHMERWQTEAVLKLLGSSCGPRRE